MNMCDPQHTSVRQPIHLYSNRIAKRPSSANPKCIAFEQQQIRYTTTKPLRAQLATQAQDTP